ncbi:MAG: hypothetical protein HC866_11905 [Leptolyngbyaceae cyanobacterium RU_5_1]|nr:hypothetical protein [Leptolyngbyaceae cyanobacterium RU_5_1]
MKHRFVRMVAFFLLALSLSIALPSLAHPPASIEVIAQFSSAADLEQQARSRYESGQFSAAATLFQQAATAYQTVGDSVRQALSLSNLSRCYQQLAAWEQANRAILDSLAILQTKSGTTPANQLALAQALDIHADLRLSRGQASAALTVWEQATTLYQQHGKPNRALASQTNQARALQHLGLHRRAIALLKAALKLPASDLALLKPQLDAVLPSPEARSPCTSSVNPCGQWAVRHRQSAFWNAVWRSRNNYS